MPRHKFKSLQPYNSLGYHISQMPQGYWDFEGLFILTPTVSSYTLSDGTKKANQLSPRSHQSASGVMYQIVSTTNDPKKGTGQLAAALQSITFCF